MRTTALLTIALLWAVPGPAQETPPAMVASYEALADTILAVRQAEANFVKALLDGHLHGAKMHKKNGEWGKAAAQIALFANEGDNMVGGVRKKLLKGGHHFNAEGEEKGTFEPGYVIVTREAKETMLQASAEMRQATTDEEREASWKKFAAVAKELLGEA